MEKLENKKLFGLGIGDIVIWILFAIVCFFSFQQVDILHTAGSSFAYLHGHFADFYKYVDGYIGVPAYMPSTYIAFAIWNIPLRIFDVVPVPTMDVPTWVLMWYKLLPVILYMLTGYLIYRICKLSGVSDYKSKIGSYVFLSCPIGFFSQFLFGQYDIFTVVFMLLGYYFYLKNNNKLFVVMFGIAITFKYFALLFFVPLVLLKCKSVLKVILSIILVCVPIGMEILLYLPSAAFRKGVLGFGAASYIFNVSFDTGYYRISIVVVLWIVVCLLAFLRERGNVLIDSIFMLNVVCYLCFGLSMWHPQWLLLAVPFMSLGIIYNKKSDILMLLELLLMCAYCMFTVNMWGGNVDAALFLKGVLHGFLKKSLDSVITMRSLYIIQDKNLIMSFFSGCLLALTILKAPRYMTVDDAEINIDEKVWYIRARFILGVLFFVVPAFICFFAAC